MSHRRVSNEKKTEILTLPSTVELEPRYNERYSSGRPVKVTVKCMEQNPDITNTFSRSLGASLYWGSTVP